MKRPSLAGLERFWTTPVDAAPLVVVRTVYGLVVAAWAISLVPDFDLMFRADGLNDPFFGKYRLVSIFRWIDHPVALAIGLGLLIVAALAVAAGRAPRFLVPLTVALQISLADYIDAWLIGAERVLRLIGLFLAAFALLTPSDEQGWLPKRNSLQSFPAGMVAPWPILLIRLQLVLAYLTTGLEKLRGPEWREGSAVYHALEIEHLRRFEAPEFLSSWEPLVKATTWGTLAVELLLPLLLLIPRTRRWAVVLGIALHFGFDLFLELGFFGPAMTVGLLAFLDPSDAKRLLRLWPFRR